MYCAHAQQYSYLASSALVKSTTTLAMGFFSRLLQIKTERNEFKNCDDEFRVSYTFLQLGSL